MTLTPLCVVYLRAVERLNRRVRKAEQGRISALWQRDDALGLVEDLRDDLREMTELADGWRRRAEALYDACDPDVRDDVLGVITTIEGLPEVSRDVV